MYEEVVEGGITRLAAIFNSHAPDVVGPVRSVRKTDQSIVWPIGGIFAYSGGAQYAIDSINTAPVKQLDESRAGPMMFRDTSSHAPFNLFAHVDQMYKAGGKPVPPPPLFVYRKPKREGRRRRRSARSASDSSAGSRRRARGTRRAVRGCALRARARRPSSTRTATTCRSRRRTSS